MTIIGWAQIALYCALLLVLVRPLGGFNIQIDRDGLAIAAA